MSFIRQRITIIQIRKPAQQTLNDELQWLGTSLGLFNLRDKDKSCFRVFLELLKAAKTNRILSSDDLADQLNLSRGTVIHHMHKLIESGIVISEGKKYLLRQDRLEILIQDLREDLQRACEEIKTAARLIDDAFTR